ncbi:YtoQ family protein, partial [Gammaproteobacteria bacterium]|nr:YtoQ family protein [Gammaproteobacteria bacterium]
MLNVYLSGEIHSDWREEIIKLCNKEDLNIKFSSPNTNHESSDNCGVEILGAEEKNFWKDNKGASINSIKTKKSIKDSDVVVVKFGEKYKQWNAAFDAGYAS